MFVDNNLLICGEILVEVDQDLLSVTGDIDHVRKVYSHPHAIAQCRAFLERNLREAPVFDVESTSRAAELAADDPSAAAIAGEAAAKIYGLKTVRKRIQDNTNNFTRCLILGKQPAARTGYDKPSSLFSARDEVGALHLMLEPFAQVQREPDEDRVPAGLKKAWEYLFFLDMSGGTSPTMPSPAPSTIYKMRAQFKRSWVVLSQGDLRRKRKG
jgi:chorismate mutase/prephenate dehydratase